jgi:hypothetical protein
MPQRWRQQLAVGDPQALHAMALRCKRLANETIDRVDKAALEDLAEDYERRAEELERRNPKRLRKRG